MTRLPARGAAATALLLVTGGAASALPPEPASAPTAAHMAPAAPPPAAISGGAAGLTPGQSNDPIDITSEGVEVIQPQRLTIFKGNVEETQGTQRLRTPELRVYYKAKQAPAGQPAGTPASGGNSPFGADQTGGIDHIEAQGPVYYITPTQNARGDYMSYVKDTDIITLTGHVVLVQGKSVAKGDKLIMNRATGQNNLISDTPQTASGRVRVILYPQQQPAAGAAPKPAAR